MVRQRARHCMQVCPKSACIRSPPAIWELVKEGLPSLGFPFEQVDKCFNRLIAAVRLCCHWLGLGQGRCLLVRQGAALSHHFTSVLSQQKTSVISRHLSCLNGRHLSCPGSMHLSCPTISKVSTVQIPPMLKPQTVGRSQNPQIKENNPKWSKNGRQVLRIHPNGSHGRSQAFGTAPTAQSPATNPKSFRGTPPLQFL